MMSVYLCRVKSFPWSTTVSSFSGEVKRENPCPMFFCKKTAGTASAFSLGLPEALSMHFQKDILGTTSQAALKTLYLLQMGVGSLANVILFFHNISPILLGHKQRPTYTILSHMAVANLMVLFSSGIPHIMTAFVWRKPLSSLGCKCVYYLQRVSRSTTLCSTCVLSTCQFLTLMLGRAERTVLRGRVFRFTGSFCCICWVSNVLMYIDVPLRIAGSQHTHNYTDTQGSWFCSSSAPNPGLGYLWSISDVVFIGLMAWSSGSIRILPLSM